MHGLRKSYGDVRAVDSLDLAVHRGSVVGLVGANGSGKTTTLRVAVGLVRPDEGRVAVSGAESGSLTARRRAAYVPDEPTGLDELTVREFLALYRALYRAEREFEPRTRRLLAAFGIEAREDTSLGSLSHGMRRQASMVAAFALGAPLVVVDEATAALDPAAVIVLREALAKLAAAGSGVLVATQDLHFAEQACSRVCLLSRGRAVADGTVDELCLRYRATSLEDAFLAAVGQTGFLDDVRRTLDTL